MARPAARTDDPADPADPADPDMGIAADVITGPAMVGPVSGGPQLVGFLEPDQLTARTSQALPRARLGAVAGAALWALRVFVLLVGVMVVYTFIAQLS